MVEATDLPLTRRAVQVFLKSCSKLSAIKPPPDFIEVEDQNIVMLDKGRERGWPIGVLIQVHLRPGTPDPASDTGIILQPLTTFLLGGGRDPGIAPANGISAMVCGLGYNPDAFVAVPELAFLRRWPSDGR